MVGYHCKVAMGEGIGRIDFFPLFEFTWLRFIGWFPGFSDCLQGGLI